jgi:hypothetical protein
MWRYLLHPIVIIILLSCGNRNAVKPTPSPEIDGRAVTLARFGAEGLQHIRYAYYQQAHSPVDTQRLSVIYTDVFLKGVNVKGYVECMVQWPLGGPGPCSFPESTSYGLLAPTDWIPNEVIPYLNLLRITILYDSAHQKVGISHPQVFQVYDSLERVLLGYFGYFTGANYTADNFRTVQLSYNIYLHQFNHRYDSIETYVRTLNPDDFLVNNTWPESGLIRRNVYVNRDSAEALSCHDGIVSDYVTGFSEYIFFTDTTGLSLDSIVRITRYTQDSTVYSYFGNRIVVLHNGNTLVQGEILSDSSFSDTLSGNKTILTSRTVSGLAYAHITLQDSARDTLLRIDPALDQTGIASIPYRKNAPADSLWYDIKGNNLAFNDTTPDLVMSGEISYVMNSLYLKLEGKRPGKSSILFSGELLVNPFSGKGSGYIEDRGNDFSYTVEMDLEGSSWLEDIEL